MGAEVKLFRTWASHYALRIEWALKLKGIEYEAIEEDLSNKSSALLKYNPVHKKVPVLVHNGKPIAESLVILEYIDETWKQNPSLLPDDPHQRARARFWARFGDEKVMPSIWNGFKKQGKEQEEAYYLAAENLKWLEDELKGKKLFGGDEIGYLDIALGWLANVVSLTEEVTGVKLISQENFPLLSTWMRVFGDFPVIKENWPPREKVIPIYRAIRNSVLSKEALNLD